MSFLLWTIEESADDIRGSETSRIWSKCFFFRSRTVSFAALFPLTRFVFFSSLRYSPTRDNNSITNMCHMSILCSQLFFGALKCPRACVGGKIKMKPKKEKTKSSVSGRQMALYLDAMKLKVLSLARSSPVLFSFVSCGPMNNEKLWISNSNFFIRRNCLLQESRGRGREQYYIIICPLLIAVIRCFSRQPKSASMKKANLRRSSSCVL